MPAGSSSRLTARITAICTSESWSASHCRLTFPILCSAATVPPFVTTTQEAARVAEQLRLFISDDLVAEDVKQAQQDLGLRIYEDAFRRAVGGES